MCSKDLKIRSYLTGKMLHLHSKDQPVNVFKERIVLYSENQMKLINTVLGK
jgi:hypothetical protein